MRSFSAYCSTTIWKRVCRIGASISPFLIAAYLQALPVYAQSYRQIVRQISNTPAVQSAKLMQMAAKQRALAAEGANLPSLDISVSGVWLKEKPAMILHLGGASQRLPVGETRQFSAQLELSYPIFTGFAISAKIERSRLEAQRAKLKVEDLRRNLILNATELYGALEALEATLKALAQAKRATLEALKKAKGFEAQGLISKADLYNIEARVYDVEAALTQSRSRKEQLLNQLSYLSGARVRSIKGTISVPNPASVDRMIAKAYRYRSDLRALKKLLRVNDAQIRLAQSRYYPQVAARATLKRHGDTLALKGDGFSNADESYLGLSLSWNIFHGGSDRHNVEAARYRKLSNASALLDYRRRVAMEIRNAFTKLRALRFRLKSAQMQLKARKEYYRLTLGRFENQLVSADELSRSIADLANAKAGVARIVSQIEVQKAKIWLLSGVEEFERRLGIAH